MKLLHTADVHLDAPFRWLGAKGREQRAQLKASFRAIIDLALREQVDVLLVAGDLFDSNSPSQDTVDLVRTQLARLNMPAVLLPGTHDCLDDQSIYNRVDLGTRDGPGVYVFDGSHTAFEIGPSLTVHGLANTAKTSRVSPLHGLRRNPGTRFNVAHAHGSLAMPGTEDDFPIAPDEIAAIGMDYLALGHWHSYRDCSAGATKAFYCGPPELLAQDESGSILLVELGDRDVSVERRVIARRRCERLSLALDGVESREEVRERIARLSHADLALSVTLTGLRPLQLVIDPDKLARELADGFFALRIEDASHPMVSPEMIGELPEKTVIGQFARRMTALIEQSSGPEEKRIRESALQVGLALLQGRRVL